MVVLVELEGRFFIREGATHSEGLRRLLGELSAAGLEVDETRTLRGQWKECSWDTGAPVLQIRWSDCQRGEDAVWATFFEQNSVGASVGIEASMKEVSRD